MEENKSKKKNNKKIIITGVIIICIMLVIVGVTIIKNNKKTEISSNLENTTNIVEGTTLFEDIGHYGVAVAGNNNADRGTGKYRNVKLIKNYPENWDEIKKNIPSDILSRISNMSGSRLDFDGNIKKAWLMTFLYNGHGTDSTKGDILIIKPDGSYEILYGKSQQLVEINIKDKGWYYVSLLSAPNFPQQAWGMSVVYENPDLSMKYIECKNNLSTVQKSFIEVYYNDEFKVKNEFELFGIIGASGGAAWYVKGENEDKVEVIFKDKTYKQLYQDTYNGKTIFEGRTNIDFANGLYSTIKSHNIRGGEIDVFYEKLGKDYFNNKDVIGYRITKVGTDALSPVIFGLSQEIYSPELQINLEKVANNIVENEKIHIKTNITNNATDEESIGYNTKVVCKLDVALSEVENIVVKINDSVIDVESVYNAETNEIQISGIDEILPEQVVTIEYDVKVNNNIQNKGEVNSNVELPIVVNVQSYPIDINTLEETEKEKYRELYVEEEKTVNITGVYKKTSGGLEIKYIDEVTGKELVEKEENIGFLGEEYITDEKKILGYELVESPINANGTMQEDKIVVVYKYRKLSKVTVRYIDLNNGEEIEIKENEYKEGENYTTDSKEFEGYRLIKISENKEGVVGRENIEVEYGYKKIVIGVEVKYIDEMTNEEIKTSEEILGIEGDIYETGSEEIEGYELVDIPLNASGEMREDLITVIYKYRKLSKVIVKYVDKNSGEEIEVVEKEYKEGDNYRTESKNINEYGLVKVPENANGVVGREDIEVVYEYRKIGGGIEIRYVDEVIGEEIETKEHQVGLIGEEYITQGKQIEGYELVTIPENQIGKIGEEKIIVTYKYRKLSKVIVKYVDKNSGKEIDREEKLYKEGDNYKINKKELEKYNYIEVIGKVEGIVERGNIEVIYYYEKIPSKITINIVNDSGKIIEVIEKEGYIGDKEEIELPEISGYYIEEKSVVIEYGKENNINITYKKKLFDLPNTSDINIYVYVGIFVVSLSFISFLIIKKLKK